MCVKKGESSITSLVSAFGRRLSAVNLIVSPKILDDYVAEKFIPGRVERTKRYTRTTWFKESIFFNTDIVKQFQDNPKEIMEMDYASSIITNTFSAVLKAYCERVLLHEITLGAKTICRTRCRPDTFSF